MDLSEFRFPMFVSLKGRKTVVIGGGKIALRRAQILLSFGAQVTLIAPECKNPPQNITYLQRPYREGDLTGAFLAVAATNDRQVNRQVGLEAMQAGIFVSVADRKEESNFFFPAICAENGLIAGVVSRGDDHKKTAVAAQAIRTLLEELE